MTSSAIELIFRNELQKETDFTFFECPVLQAWDYRIHDLGTVAIETSPRSNAADPNAMLAPPLGPRSDGSPATASRGWRRHNFHTHRHH
jgi:hypothetical protein